MQIAVAGMEDVGDVEAIAPADPADLVERLGQLGERDHAVHAVIVGELADGAERRLAALPDRGALLGALAPMHDTRDDSRSAISRDRLEQRVDLVLGTLDLDDEQRLDVERIAGARRNARRRGSRADP